MAVSTGSTTREYSVSVAAKAASASEERINMSAVSAAP